MMRRVSAFLLIVALILADQISKWWVIEMFLKPRVFEAQGGTLSFLTWMMTLGQDRFPPARVEIMPYFNIVMVWNQGVSFGMLASAEAYMPYVLGGGALLMCAVLIHWMRRATYLTTLIPLAMIVAGAVGNVWDRVRFGGVADFLDFYYQEWHYPAFNIADCCIVVGVIALAVDGLLIEPRRTKKESVA